MFTSPCTAGFYSPPSGLCQECPQYTFKDIPGYESCFPCLNKPPNSYYLSEVGLKNVICPYKCNSAIGKLNNTSECNYILQGYLNSFDGFLFPTVIIIIISIIVFGRILKTVLKKRMSIIEYDYKNLEDVLGSEEKIEL